VLLAGRGTLGGEVEAVLTAVPGADVLFRTCGPAPLGGGVPQWGRPHSGQTAPGPVPEYETASEGDGPPVSQHSWARRAGPFPGRPDVFRVWAGMAEDGPTRVEGA